MTNNVIDKDLGWRKIVESVKINRDGKAAFVGIQGSEAEVEREEYGTAAEIAAVQEFGTKDGKIPSRPFMRQPFDNNEQEYIKEYNRIIEMFYQGKDIEGELLLLGEMYKAHIVKAIKANEYQPWAPSTAAQKSKQNKAGDPVLWHSGTMINSLSVDVKSLKDKDNG